MWPRDIKQQEQKIDISFLSPIQEKEESFDSPRRPRPRLARPARPDSPLPRLARLPPARPVSPLSRLARLPPARPDSPLPPLIIEVEKRVNKHDHPEEFYVRLEKKMKNIYRRLFIEGRNVSSPVSSDDDEDEPEDRSNSNINIDEVINEDYGNNVDTEPVSAISDRRLKRGRATSDTDSSQSEEDGVQSKKPKGNESSSSALLPKSSYTEFGDETIVSSIAEEGGIEIKEENIHETNAKVDINSLVAEESTARTYNVDRDEDENTSEYFDHIRVTFQADVHRACDPGVKDVHIAYEPSGDLLPSANVGDEMDDENGGYSADESGQDSETVDDKVQEILENNDGRNVSSPVSNDDGEDKPEDRLNSNIDIDEVINEDYGNNVDIEPVSAISDRRLKRGRATSDTDSSQSEEDGVQSKKPKGNESSSSALLPKSSYTEFGDETIVSSIAEEGGIEIKEENIHETNAKVDINSLVAEESTARTYNVDRDEDENTSEYFDHIRVTFQADVHRACDPGVKDVHIAYEPSGDLLPSANVGDEMDDENGGYSADESGQDSETVDDKAQAILENNDVPYNLLAPAPEREVELMRTPRIRSYVGSEPERRGDSSHDEQHLNFELLNRTQDDELNRTHEDVDWIEERDQGTQTCFEDINMPEGWGNIFFGQPRVYKLMPL